MSRKRRRIKVKVSPHQEAFEWLHAYAQSTALYRRQDNAKVAKAVADQLTDDDEPKLVAPLQPNQLLEWLEQISHLIKKGMPPKVVRLLLIVWALQQTYFERSRRRCDFEPVHFDVLLAIIDDLPDPTVFEWECRADIQADYAYYLKQEDILADALLYYQAAANSYRALVAVETLKPEEKLAFKCGYLIMVEQLVAGCADASIMVRAIPIKAADLLEMVATYQVYMLSIKDELSVAAKKVYEKDWLQLMQTLMSITVLKPDYLDTEALAAVVAPVQPHLLALYTKYYIHQPRLPSRFDRQLEALAAGEAKVDDDDSAFYLALPSKAMANAPSHGFREGRKDQLAGGSAWRLAWMIDGVMAGLAEGGKEKPYQLVVKPGDAHDQAADLLLHLYGELEWQRLLAAGYAAKRLELPMALDSGDTFINAATVPAVLECMANTHALTEAVLATPKSQATSGMAVQRPPSHHAGVDKVADTLSGDSVGNGFCVGNVILAEAIYRAVQGVKVLVFDLDVHSGNGTLQLLRRLLRRLSLSTKASDLAMAATIKANLRFVNCFQDRIYPYEDKPYAKSADSDLPAELKAMVVNIPYKSRTKGSQVTLWVKEAVGILAGSGFKADLNLVSYGMDAHHLDAMSGAQFMQQDYYDLLMAVEGKTVVLPEGGYNQVGLTEAMCAAVCVCHEKTHAHVAASKARASASAVAASRAALSRPKASSSAAKQTASATEQLASVSTRAQAATQR